MGPRLQERGVERRQHESEMPLNASMGPRLQERGVFRDSIDQTTPNAASMGPRLQERGVRSIRGGFHQQIVRLQWGRAYKSAEFDTPTDILDSPFPASMGPRLQERGVSFSIELNAPVSWSFNGAALTRARS